ncbi:hypothetical protein [Nostoc sp.]
MAISINHCNISLGKDAIHRVSTNGLFVVALIQCPDLRSLSKV